MGQASTCGFLLGLQFEIGKACVCVVGVGVGVGGVGVGVGGGGGSQQLE